MIQKDKRKYAKPFLDPAFEPKSRPDYYPIPDIEDLVFYIQRNYNTDTIVYQAVKSEGSLINLNQPLKPFWIKYNSDERHMDLNYMQKKLAYGYEFNVINNNLIEFKFVSYDKRFFLAQEESGNIMVTTSIDNRQVIVNNAYIYAEENGIFPDVKFIEFYGKELHNREIPVYHKVDIGV